MIEPALQNVPQDIYQMLTGDVLNVKELARNGVTLVVWTGKLYLYISKCVVAHTSKAMLSAAI